MPAPIGNKFALGNNGGRPPKFDSPEQMENKINEYFQYCEGEWDEEKDTWKRHPEPITITGLVLFIGFCDRHTFYEYEKKQEFSHVVKRAKSVVENNYEGRLHYNNPTGAIFALKNMGWKDNVYTENINHNKEIPNTIEELDAEIERIRKETEGA